MERFMQALVGRRRRAPKAPDPDPGPDPDHEPRSPSIDERIEERLRQRGHSDLHSTMRGLTTGRSFASSPLSARGRVHENRDEYGSDRSREGSQSSDGHVPRHPSVPESEFLAHALQNLDRSHSTSSRAEAALSLSRDLTYYSAATATTILRAAEDLGSNTSDTKSRTYFFQLLEATAIHKDLSSDDREHIFRLSTTSLPATEMYHQIKSLRALTDAGADLEPFGSAFATFLVESLGRQYGDAEAARRKKREHQDRSKTVVMEERGLFSLLQVIAETLAHNADIFSSDALESIIRETVHIAEKTPSKMDMERAVGVLRSTVEHARIPGSQLRQCVEVMCAIASAITELKEATMDYLEQLLRSPDQDAVITTLLETVALAPNERHAHTVGGALSILSTLVCLTGGADMPNVAFSQLLNALDGVHFANRRTRRDTLKTLVVLLEEEAMTADILDSDWEQIIKIILTATGDETYIHDRDSDPLTVRAYTAGGVISDMTTEESLADDITSSLESLANLFNSLWLKLKPTQRQLVSVFYFKLRRILPASIMRTLIQSLINEGHFDHQNTAWQDHQLELLRLFMWNRDMDPETCCLIIHKLSDTVPISGIENLEEVSLYEGEDYLEHYHMIILRLLNDLEYQLTLDTANALAAFAGRVWLVTLPGRMDEILPRFWKLLQVKDMTSEDEPHGDDFEIRVNKVSLVFVKLFLRHFRLDREGSIALFNFLIEIAKARDLSPAVRLPTLRLLIRLRCDALDRVFVNEVSDTLALAQLLSRTEATVGPTGKYSLDRPLYTTPPVSRRSRASGKMSSRTSTGPEQASRSAPTLPLWLYPGGPGLPANPPKEASNILYLESSGHQGLKFTEWLIVLIELLQQGAHWEVYSYILVHLPSQLCHPNLFVEASAHIKMLRNIIVSQLKDGTFQEPPSDTGVSKGDVALCLYHSLTALLGYHDLFARSEQDDIIKAFLAGIGNWERTAKHCIQSLAISCHMMPGAIKRSLPHLLLKMSQIITKSHLTIDILEFLGGLARLPDLYSTFREDEYRMVFALCVKYLEHTREQREKLSGTVASEADYDTSRASITSSRPSTKDDTEEHVDLHRDLPQYVFALAYHVITIWFLSLKMKQRPDHVGWITKNLAWRDSHGNEHMEEQSQVTLDMMHRVTYSDLGETAPRTSFQTSDGEVLSKTWLVGLSIVTIETAAATGLTKVIKRQASGTTYATYQQHSSLLPAHHAPLPEDVGDDDIEPQCKVNIFPNHVFLQLASTIAPTPSPMEPISLPNDDMARRALSSFDRNDTVDGYKVGVIYVGNAQENEADILANLRGDEAYDYLLEGLGTKIPLKGATFNTQGLDRESDSDGQSTYAWRDRVAEIVYHVTTMMPGDWDDPTCIKKKMHIGNDFVNIIFNNSGVPWKLDNIKSQFNCVNIVIAPTNKPAPYDEQSEEDLKAKGAASLELSEAQRRQTIGKTCYTIQVISQPSFPQISPAACYKLMPLANIPSFARQLALQCSVFSNVWTNRAGGEVITSWRNRLREIYKLRERFANTGESTSKKYPGAKEEKTYKAGDRYHARVEMGGLAEEVEGVVVGLDFSRWAGPNPPVV